MTSTGIIMTINPSSGYVVVAGTVAGLAEGKKDNDEWFAVRLHYEDEGEIKETDIYFWNDSEADDYRRYQADKAKRKNLQEGSAIVVRCRFRDDTKKEATGYGIYYSGLIRIRPDTEHEKDDRSVLVGTVTSMKDVTVRGQDAVRLNVYAGKVPASDGGEMYQNVSVTLLGSQAVMARTDLAEEVRDDGTMIRKKAVFRCGAVRTFYMSAECPVCYETMQFDENAGKMVCPGCGAQVTPDSRDRREAVYAYDYIVIEDRVRRRGE